ncbi:FliH/SctL family protein [Thalassolituus sp. UBA2590]|uniref:FliH/SctL family protein n=1 Tax=Thalassolituus sp. UBA2590 TaxID=1947663 RepID=UPI002646FEBA|nr:FliH/SctL family protein [Thalassolituus sp. UBA2590]
MTELKKRDAPIPAESAEEARPWRLPFWTEPPVHTVEREPDPEAEELDAESVDDSPPDFPTAEELESIRREAYNAGLEQGLVEGRQQGHKDGYDAGFAEGQEDGHAQGFDAGKKEGSTAGFQEGKALGSQEVTDEAQRLRQINATLTAALKERDAELPEVMLMLLTRLAEQVLEHELNSGADSIAQFVDKAIAALPSGETLAKVYVSEADSELLASHSAASKLLVDKALNAGECRVESENTLVEYSVSESLQQTIVALANKLLTASDGYPDDSSGESALVDVPEDTGADDELSAYDDTEEATQDDVQQPEASTSEALKSETQQSETQQSEAEQPVEAEPPETENGSGLEQSTEQNIEPDTSQDTTTEESDDDSEQPLA